MNSREKGKRGEREAAAYLRKHGFEARRGQQYSGSDNSPDVVHNVPGVHLEVKRTERLILWKALAQAIEDSSEKIPVVMHKCNKTKKKDDYPKGEWIVVLMANDFLDMIKDLYKE